MVKKLDFVGGGAFGSLLNSSKYQKASKFSKNANKKAFSVAEATIALLIGSIALGAAAPMITKQLRQNNFNDVQTQIIERRLLPPGAIMFFEDDCPPDWIDMSGSYAGRYIRIAGTYNICDKYGEENGTCKNIGTKATLAPGTLQGESNRRLVGTLPGNDADGPQYDKNEYVAKLHEYGFLSGAFDYVRPSDITDPNSPFGFPTEWKTMRWKDFSFTSKMYFDEDKNEKYDYLIYTDPNLLSAGYGAEAPKWYLNSIDTRRVLPTDIVNDETRPKTIVLKACKSPR